MIRDCGLLQLTYFHRLRHIGLNISVGFEANRNAHEPGVIPTANRSASESLEWVVDAGWVAMVRVSPRLAECDNILSEFKTYDRDPGHLLFRM